MYVRLCSTADRLLRLSLENASKRLDYSAVVELYQAFVAAFIRQEGGVPLSGRRNTGDPH